MPLLTASAQRRTPSQTKQPSFLLKDVLVLRRDMYFISLLSLLLISLTDITIQFKHYAKRAFGIFPNAASAFLLGVFSLLNKLCKCSRV